MNKWYESEVCDTGTIIGGQVCLVRNIAGFPFEDKMNADQQDELLEKVCYALREAEPVLDKKFRFIRFGELNDLESKSYVARLSVPPLMLSGCPKCGLLLSEDESISILINGKEHLCIQVSCPGAGIRDALKMANLTDDLLNEHLTYAYSDKYGYLTASPLLTGTGMTVSYLLHLPYLEKQQRIEKFEKELWQYGFSLGGHFHGKTQAPGSIYRVRNRKTLGLSDAEILSALEHLTDKLVRQEGEMGSLSFGSEKFLEIDMMYRAYGLLRYSRDLSYDETMTYLSMVRSGDMYLHWQGDGPTAGFEMMTAADVSVLSAMTPDAADEKKTGYYRSRYMHSRLGDVRDLKIVWEDGRSDTDRDQLPLT